ncbi:MAG TPA: 3-isopropylmalate dehydrogenase [Vicinamibacterales bacterium]|nr:3-isopropylmalate dehydrogenase [Vicinamibacterales bacterium]
MRARIVLLPGDGIGPEVLAAARLVLDGISARFHHDFQFESHAIGGAALRQGLAPLPDETRLACANADAVLLGAVGDPAFDARPPGQRPESALLQIRRELKLFANLRPARVWPGLEAAGPLDPKVLQGTDMLVVRELTGGLYYGEPRGIAEDGGEAWNTMRYSRPEIERIAHVAFDVARTRRRRVTSVDKANVLETSRLWRQVVNEVARGYPDVQIEHMYVDACAMKIALAPASFDVLLTPNLFGDILSDEAGAIVGSLGLLPSASTGEGSGLFEPVHGSAPDLAGRNVANPVGAILSAAMLLRHALRLEPEAAAIEQAVEAALRSGARTVDLAGTGTGLGTREMAEAISAAVDRQPMKAG